MTFFKRSLLLCLIAFSTFSSFAQTTSFKSAMQKKSGTLEYYYISSPAFADNVGGKETGICVDILNGFETWVKSKYGITLKTRYIHSAGDSFVKFLTDIKTGGPGVIGAGGVTITEKRKEAYTFSHEFMTNVSILATHANAPTLSSAADMSTAFSGMTALAVKGTTNEKALLELKAKHFKNMTIEYLPSIKDLSQKIAENQKYFSIMDLGYYLSSMKQHRTIKRQPAMDMSNELLGFIMPKGSDWAPVLSEYIRTVYNNSPERRKSIAAHLGPSALRLLDSVGQ
ncbi:substrate-binding periplasmic protein [Marinigracilibium pacificum]|uniref:ABC transporter substrate-binding protein n=1 Tax=Marinigracilibium pacificum TaxID=2729599 RepID=A0A848ITQ8_9BACT|nr:ABC transporter substrate-binding protein [Marinigracilibium pacificum]NMM47136.1 ABC transporter substrate-binding protein [Marinigracilibium pacificum]